MGIMIKVALYTSGPNVISRMIRLIQGNKHTHVALILNDEPEQIDDYEILEIENLTGKSRVVKLGDTLKYCRVIKIMKTEGYVMHSQIADNLVGKKYSGLALVDACINHLLGRFNSNHKYKKYLASEDKFTCSSLVATAIKRYGYSTLRFPDDLSTVEPDDYDKSPWKVVAVLDQDFQKKWR